MVMQQGKLEFDFSANTRNDKVEKSKYKKEFPTEEDSMFKNKRALNNAKKKKHFKNKKLK